MSIQSIVDQIGLSRWMASAAAGAFLATAATLAFPGASAQQMPNSGAWLSGMIGQQMMLQRQGNGAVQNSYNFCISHPGACQPTPGAASAAINALQNQYRSNFVHSQNNYNTIYNTNRKFDIGVIQQRCWVQKLPNGMLHSNC